MFKIPGNFIGNFKLGDNIHHNLAILALLYRVSNKAEDDAETLLYKPITITMASIIEAILYDFHGRIKSYTKEGVQGLPKKIISYIQQKQLDELGKYIASAKKHNFFDAADNKFYEDLDTIRKLRNRIHIQNTKQHFERDEIVAFDKNKKELAEKVLEKVMKTMARKYNRPHSYSSIGDFELPWNEHYP